jgi:HD-like signal output (HDOD) protein/DNA-binding CsgD family transcriptional regulator
MNTLTPVAPETPSRTRIVRRPDRCEHPPPPKERHIGGEGRRFTFAFEALDAYPALLEPRERALAIGGERAEAQAEAIAAIEADVALSIAVLRHANASRAGGGRIEDVSAAVELLGAAEIVRVAGAVPSFDFFEHAGRWGGVPAAFRLHALATQRAADRLAMAVCIEGRNRIAIASLLHDVGKLVMIHAYAGYPAQVHAGARTPEERVALERRELNVDHALIGGLALRRWGLPDSLAATVERHHDPDADGEAALVGLADMLARYERGASVSARELVRRGRRLGLEAGDLRAILYELPRGASGRPRAVLPCPLSPRELAVLHSLADGRIYKEIGADLRLSVSTVRSHLMNIYGKLGTNNRAQAVLTATRSGWI